MASGRSEITLYFSDYLSVSFNLRSFSEYTHSNLIFLNSQFDTISDTYKSSFRNVSYGQLQNNPNSIYLQKNYMY